MLASERTIAEGISLSFWNPNSLHYVIDWSAWATLVAVIGAVIIGIMQVNIAGRQVAIADRQAQIMERQARIAAQQADTEQTRLRADLYDRRLSVYVGIERYLIDASIRGGKVEADVRDEIFKSISVASFLLDDEIAAIGRKLIQVSSSLRANVRRLETIIDEAKRPDLLDKIDGNENELADLHLELRNHMNKYLKLGYKNSELDA